MLRQVRCTHFNLTQSSASILSAFCGEAARGRAKVYWPVVCSPKAPAHHTTAIRDARRAETVGAIVSHLTLRDALGSRVSSSQRVNVGDVSARHQAGQSGSVQGV